MNISEKIKQFTESITTSLADDTFVKLTLANYKGTEDNLKNIYLKRILIKNEDKLSFTFRYKTRDIVKNYTFGEGLKKVEEYLSGGFQAASLLTTGFNLSYENFDFKKSIIRKSNPTILAVPTPDHNRSKNRLITSIEKPYLAELKITDQSGKVLVNSQDKYKQINHYIEILSSLIKEIPVKETLKIVDMGSGKGYLTFALYDYLTNVVKLKTEITGVEFRPDLVELCNTISAKTGFNQLRFEQGTIENFDSTGTDILIALHACDTATDDAIYKGISAGASLIVVAPCCHKQIRRQVESHKALNNLDFLTKYGIFLERQCEMVTDGIRALVLEYFGYKTKVFEFVSDAHTPKNVMVVGIKNARNPYKDERILQKIKETKAYFGIGYHHLEKMMGI
jgi:hypothetical protein